MSDSTCYCIFLLQCTYCLGDRDVIRTKEKEKITQGLKDWTCLCVTLGPFFSRPLLHLIMRLAFIVFTRVVESSCIFWIISPYLRNRKCLVIFCFFVPFPVGCLMFIQGHKVASFKLTLNRQAGGECMNYFLLPCLVTYRIYTNIYTYKHRYTSIYVPTPSHMSIMIYLYTYIYAHTYI